MVKHLLPMGLRGIVVAGLLSALMGSLAGVFNACSTLFTVDLYEKLRPRRHPAPDRPHRAHRHRGHGGHRPGVDSRRQGRQQPLRVSAGVQGYLAPPIFVVFFFGVFFKRLNAKGCLWAMVVGFVLGVFRMIVDTPVTMGLERLSGKRRELYQPGKFLWIINNINFQYFSILITIVSAVVMVAVSLATAPPSATQIKSLTFGTATEEDKLKTRASWGWQEVLASWIVLAAILGAYLYFRVSRNNRAVVRWSAAPSQEYS